MCDVRRFTASSDLSSCQIIYVTRLRNVVAGANATSRQCRKTRAINNVYPSAIKRILPLKQIDDSLIGGRKDVKFYFILNTVIREKFALTLITSG